ncbi:MAG: cellulase family glycosylhydrolase [Clostridiales bacterium]|jgi:mannan endo-1,4-beta-mannosidase|nr:cellulase family glycosylhydrolase [Clostridiales bacterium]
MEKAKSLELHTERNLVINSAGEITRLLGVNRCGLEFDALDERIFDDVLHACGNWRCNVIRLPISQDRWFGFGPEQEADRSGALYRLKIDGIIDALYNLGKYAIVDLHWSDMNVWGSHIGQHCMPDLNSLKFFEDAARRYKDHPAVLFGLYNEPHDVSWDVWKNGGEVFEIFENPGTHEKVGVTYATAGLQRLADAVRASGAGNIMVIGGLDWAFSLKGLSQGYGIAGENIIYDAHVYPWKPLEWDEHITEPARKHPVIIGEFGHYGDNARPREGAQKLKSAEWMNRVLNWIDRNNFHFTAWDFHPFAGPCLIKGWDNEPTEYFGVYVKKYLLANLPKDYEASLRKGHKLCTPYAMPVAQELYDYLFELFGRHILSGQQECPHGDHEREMKAVFERTGKYPAIRGLDFIDGDFEHAADRAAKWWRKGGIPTICWHWGAPPDGVGYKSSQENVDFGLLMDETSSLFKGMIRQMDEAAQALLKLQRENVPVLWRPFHEFDGGWFWWGKGGGEAFIKLWKLMHDRFSSHFGLKNLIWVLGYADYVLDGWYPGDGYVDIIGSDTYKFTIHENAWLRLQNITKKPMPIALHECGAIPDPDELIGKKLAWLWFDVWHTRWLEEDNPEERLKRIYSHPYVLALEDVSERILRIQKDS